jgi:hypothetical protein
MNPFKSAHSALSINKVADMRRKRLSSLQKRVDMKLMVKKSSKIL